MLKPGCLCLALLPGNEYVAPAPKADVGDDYQADVAGSISVGSRCCVDPGERRATVRWVVRV